MCCGHISVLSTSIAISALKQFIIYTWYLPKEAQTRSGKTSHDSLERVVHTLLAARGGEEREDLQLGRQRRGIKYVPKG